MQIFLIQYIMHYLNYTLTMLASYGGKTSTQLTVSTFSRKQALRIINFKGRNAHSSPLFYHSKIIKISDKVKIENCLFIKKYTNTKLASVFTN